MPRLLVAFLEEAHGWQEEMPELRTGMGIKPERDLRKEEVLKMLEIAKSRNRIHWLLLCLISYAGFRQGEVVGNHDKRIPGLPGLQIEDLQDQGIWVQGKGGYRDFQPLQDWLILELRAFIGKRTRGPIFAVGRGRFWQIVQDYAHRAGITDWKLIHPHSFRHFFGSQQAKKTGRDPWKVRDMMRHRDIKSTSRYVGRLDVTEKKQLAEGMNEFV